MHARLPLFVYGTLKPGEANYPRYLGGRTQRECPAILRAAALYLDRYPYVTLDPAVATHEDYVTGVLVELDPAQYDQVFVQLDELEEYRAGAPDNLYERVIVTVETDAGPQEAWMYVAGPAVQQAIRAGHLRRLYGAFRGQQSRPEWSGILTPVLVPIQLLPPAQAAAQRP